MYQQLRYVAIVLLLPIFSTRAMEPDHIEPKIKTIDKRVSAVFENHTPNESDVLHGVPPELVNAHCLPFIQCKNYNNYRRGDRHVKVSCPVIAKFGEKTVVGEYEQDIDGRGNLYHNFLNPKEQLSTNRQRHVENAVKIYEFFKPLRGTKEVFKDSRYKVMETFAAISIHDGKFGATYIIPKMSQVEIWTTPYLAKIHDITHDKIYYASHPVQHSGENFKLTIK